MTTRLRPLLLPAWLALQLLLVSLPAAAGEAERPLQLAMGMLDPQVPAVLSPGTIFRDCRDCPEVVVVPGGTFAMGATLEEEVAANLPQRDRGRSEPVHGVIIGQSFAVGRYEVTRAEFARFVAASGRVVSGCWLSVNQNWKLFADRNWQSPGFPQRDYDPVVCVSWDDANAFTQWLSQQTHQRYRLLSEAEWEYVARAGSLGSRPWGEQIGRNYTACADCGSQWDNQRPAPAGSFSANRYYVHDMLGNVSEWVADCWHASYQHAPEDGSAWVEPSCPLHVYRGGSWQSPSYTVRSAYRERDQNGSRTTAIGFRVVREIEP